MIDQSSPIELPNELWDLIASKLGPRELVPFSGVDKSLREISITRFKNLYKKTFGEIDDNQPIYPSAIHPLQFGEKHPNPAINHNIYKMPDTFLERWRWYLGINNRFDSEVQENYDKSVGLLEKTQATSIIQLQNKLQAFWHLDRQIKDYKTFKTQARASLGIISTLFFRVVGFLFKLYCQPSVVATGKKLELRSKETFAKIGHFKLGDKQYDVIASHLLADEQSPRVFDANPYCCFYSVNHGVTKIYIFEKGVLYSKSSFSIQMMRELLDDPGRFSYEGDRCRHGIEVVTNDRRYLDITHQRYNDNSTEIVGSNRELAQKLTQIMIEMTMQNKEILELLADSEGDDFPILAAGGFESMYPRISKKKIEDLKKFRAHEGNKLFPPRRNYLSTPVTFYPKDFHVPNVYYSKEEPHSKGEARSWSEIINQGPILGKDSGILPEYWEIAPKLAKDNNSKS